ncbi:MAG: CCA tRNA nucleotidyltransferase [Nitrospiraceae bacterium]|nr:MAG: CCA tRNA nucleotidyltransferase [Nitrospiraceae bacterium]
MNLSEKILSDPVNRWIFENSIHKCFLVGGYVRDVLIGRSYEDRDYIGRNIKTLSLKTAKKFNGKVIYLKKYNMYRVVTNEKNFIDFTEMGRNVVSDLKGRDFKINAIAWSLGDGIVDPLCGTDDIRRKIVQHIHDKSLLKDPVRCIRAFRIAADLHFSVENKTLTSIKKNVKHLKSVASERITDECIKLMNIHNNSELILLMLNTHVLHDIIPLSSDILNNNICLIKELDDMIRYIKTIIPVSYSSYDLIDMLDTKIKQNLSRYGLLKLALLTFTEDIESNSLSRLTIGTSILRRVQSIHAALRISMGRLTRNKLYGIFRLSNECMEEVSLIISVIKKRKDLYYFESVDKMKEIISRKTGLTGYDIQKIASLAPGRKIGIIKEEMYRQMFLGNLQNKDDVLKFLKANLT